MRKFSIPVPSVKAYDAAAPMRLSCRSSISPSLVRCQSWCIVSDYWIVKSI